MSTRVKKTTLGDVADGEQFKLFWGGEYGQWLTKVKAADGGTCCRSDDGREFIWRITPSCEVEVIR